MRVVKWISWAEAERQGLKEAVGGLGGFFENGMRWPDYLAEWPEEAHPYLEALYAEILERGIKNGGFWHQRSEEGVPVFEDGTVASRSEPGAISSPPSGAPPKTRTTGTGILPGSGLRRTQDGGRRNELH